LSQHPVDVLIRSIARGDIDPYPEAVQQIRERVAEAPFYDTVTKTSSDLVGREYLGRIVQSIDKRLFQHLVKRVLDDEQWRFGTTEDQYAASLCSIALHPSTDLALYVAPRGAMVGAFASTEILVRELRGPKTLPLLCVFYSADRGKIITGYQAT
jgi:hypothetical protein